jgi:dihydrofolate reductase
MRKLSIFESVTLNGYFSGPDGDMSWAHASSEDPEFQQFVRGNASVAGMLLFGRVTYQMMASYWPTPAAAQAEPVVAKGMNEAEKVVFSRTLEKVDWSKTTLVRGDVPDAVRTLKKQSGKDLVVLGSGTVVTPLVDAGLVDEYQLVVKPVVLGKGRTLFEGVKKHVALELTSSRSFGNGSVVLNYVPAR